MKEYKIEKNVPLTRRSGAAFDETCPEYVIMMKMKVGDSFEFPRERSNYIFNCRAHLQKKGSPLCFSTTSRDAFYKNTKKMTGRCWRVADNSRQTRKKPNQKKPNQ
jgi:hypothetical protein